MNIISSYVDIHSRNMHVVVLGLLIMMMVSGSIIAMTLSSMLTIAVQSDMPDYLIADIIVPWDYTEPNTLIWFMLSVWILPSIVVVSKQECGISIHKIRNS